MSKTVRSIEYDDETWNLLLQATVSRSIEEGKSVSVSELVRRGSRRELAEIYGPAWYKSPKNVKALKKLARGDELEALK